MKKLEIEKTKPPFIISTFKTDMIKVGLVFSISNFFIAKTSVVNNWKSFSSSYSALEKWGHATILPRLLAKKYGEHLLDSLDSDGQDREYD